MWLHVKEPQKESDGKRVEVSRRLPSMEGDIHLERTAGECSTAVAEGDIAVPF